MNVGTGPIVHASTTAVVRGSVGSCLPAVRTGKTRTGGRYDSSPQRVTRTGKTGTRDVHEGKTKHITRSGKTSTSDGRGPSDGPQAVAIGLASSATAGVTFLVAAVAQADITGRTEATASRAVCAVVTAAI